jgi:hypothetical protein
MSKEDNGGPAFPKAGLDPWHKAVEVSPGMTLRDYFAAKAMYANLQTITEFPDEHWRIGLAMDAYLMADAMLEVRNK